MRTLQPSAGRLNASRIVVYYYPASVKRSARDISLAPKGGASLHNVRLACRITIRLLDGRVKPKRIRELV